MCRYCANFFHDDFAKQFQMQTTAAMARKSHIFQEGEIHPADKSLRYIRTVRMSSNVQADDAQRDPTTGEHTAEVLHTASAKAHKALDIIGEKMEENAKVATFEEIKISTEIMLGITMD